MSDFVSYTEAGTEITIVESPYGYINIEFHNEWQDDGEVTVWDDGTIGVDFQNPQFNMIPRAVVDKIIEIREKIYTPLELGKQKEETSE